MFEGFTDWHSHILPGVDDGIKTMEEALEVLEAYERLGVRKIWLTPHIMEDYPNTPEELRARYEELRSAYTGSIELRLAAENMLDNLFEERLEANDLLPIGDERNHLLVETSYYTPPYGMDDMLEKIRQRGYFVVLAHPERYRYMEEKDYHRYKDMGVKFQLNFVSLVGGYGDTARRKAEWLLSQGMIDVTGSDVHRLGSMSALIEKSPSGKATSDTLLSIVENKIR